MLELLWLPFLACLVLTGIHVYLGLHVLARGVIFVDLALAQVAALGITAAILAVLYGRFGVLHGLIRRPLLGISFDPEGARARGRAMRGWDFCFYVTFGVVVTSSVRVAGVLLVFSYLIVPAAVAALLAGSVARRLVTGWALGFLVSVLGLWASFAWDLPTGAAVVATFGAMMAGVPLVRGGLGLARGVRERGWEALRGVGLVGCCALGLAGLPLAGGPRMDHHWQN